jgi:hypothetical protein
MKGDAYAGGMLKPELRYGFKYKDGKIHFADGTSFAAKKTKGKDGKVAYAYTGSDGVATSYSPTDEQNAYNKKYKAATADNGFFEKVGNTLGFELWKGKDMLKNFGVNNLFFGVDPLGTKIGNAVTGRDDKPLVDALGGATSEDFQRYGKPTGFAKPLHAAAHTIAGMYAANGLGNLASSGLNAINPASTGADLGVFSNGGAGGLADVGVGNAGRLANSGAITGGAGVVSNFGGAAGAGAGMPGASSGWMDWIPSLISAGSALIGGNQASKAVEAGSKEAIAESRRQFDTVRGDTAPVRALGNAAIDRLARYYGYGTETGAPDMSAFIQSPDYQFNLQEGQKGIDRSAAARGGLLSGSAVKEGIRYSSGLASRENSAFIDRLMQQAGLGNTGIGQSAAAGANTASNVGNAAMNSGNARASIYNNTAANVNNSIQTGVSNRMLSRYLGQP